MSVVLNKSYEDACRFVAQGNYNQAIRCFKQYDPKGSNPEIVRKIKECRVSLARRLWKQGKTEEFSKIISELDSNEWMSLALARMRGDNTLHTFAETRQGLNSVLAACSLEQDVKSGLRMLRKHPDMKCAAEGWLALSKGDHQRAIELFAQGKSTASKQADIGMGVALLCSGDLFEADKYLNSLRPFSEHRFPLLSKVMGWQSIEEGQKREAAKINIHLPLNELLTQEKTIHTAQKTAQALVALRIGDHLALMGNEEAIPYWNKAEMFDPQLKLDVLKRRFQAAISDRCNFNISPHDAFVKFYNKLKKHSETDAVDFIHTLVFDASFSVSSYLSYIDIFNEYKPFTKGRDLPQIKLFWLSLFYDNVLKEAKNVLFLKGEEVEDVYLNGIPWIEWVEFFENLDPLYSMKELYLNCKLAIAMIFKEHDAIRRIAYSLLQLNPHLVEGMLPTYISAAIQYLKQDVVSSREIMTEITTLRTLFPRNFDLIRLLKIVDTEKFENQLDSFKIQLSEPLYEVLKLQHAIDRGDSLTKIKNMIPGSSLLNISKEADWRLFAALSDKRINYPKKSLSELLQKLAPDSEAKHEFFTHMRQHGYDSPPFLIIQQWMRKNKTDWRPYYHMMHYHSSENNKDEFIKMLVETDQRIIKDVREYAEIRSTLKYIIDEYPELLIANMPSSFNLLQRMFNQLVGG